MIVVLIGVAGSGKTTIGSKLASDLGWRFYDADDPDVMDSGPIGKRGDGASRAPDDSLAWLDATRREIEAALADGESLVVACAALTDRIRQRLVGDHHEIRVVYLRAKPELVRARLRLRSGYFAKEGLIASQFASLEEPAPSRALTIDVEARPGRIVEQIRDALGL